MAYVEFDGKLDGDDSPSPSYTPFDGKLDDDSSQIVKGFKTGVTGAKQMGVAAATIPVIGAMKSLGSVVDAYDKIDRGEKVETFGADFTASNARMYANSKPEMRAKLRELAIKRVTEQAETKNSLVKSWKAYQEEQKATSGRTQNFTDIDDVKSFGDWLAFNSGQGVPYLSASALSAALGGVLGGPGGAAAATVGAGYLMGAGDIQGGNIEKGVEEKGAGAALVGAIPYAALDLLGPVGRSFRGVSKPVLEQAAGGYFKRLGREVPKNAIEEFINEAGQEIVKDAAVSTSTGEKVLTDENLKNWFNAGMAGAATGAVASGVTAAVNKPTPVDAPAVPTEATPQPAEVAPAPEPLLIGNTPDPWISFPDGSVGKRADVESYIAGLPQEQQMETRARLLGLAPQPAEATVSDIQSAPSVDEAIAAANEVVSGPPEQAKNDQIDAAWKAHAAQLEAQRQSEFTQAEQARREADMPTMQAQAADQQVEQANALTSAQGFDTQEPTAMQLAMQAAQDRRKAALTPVSRRDATLSIPQKTQVATAAQPQSVQTSASAPAQTQQAEPNSTAALSVAPQSGINEAKSGSLVMQADTSQPAQQVQSSALQSPQSARANVTPIQTGTGAQNDQYTASTVLSNANASNRGAQNIESVERPAAPRGQAIAQSVAGRPADTAKPGEFDGTGVPTANASLDAKPALDAGRRKDVAERRRVADMTPEERANALLTSDLTNIPNQRAFREHVQDNPQDKVLYGDLDDFKSLNTKYGHDGADQILRGVGAIKAAVAKRVGVRAYHRSGDEFLATSDDDAKLEQYGKDVQDVLSRSEFEITMPDGSTVVHKKVGFSYGTGKNDKLAELKSDEQKVERKRLGLRVGTRSDIQSTEPGRQADQDNTAGRNSNPDGLAAAANKILNAANITGKERIDALKDIKSGAITIDELGESYPAKQEIAPPASPAKDAVPEATAEQKDESDPDITLLHSGLNPIEAIKSIGKKIDDATKTKMPEWLKQLPVETQEAARKAGVYVEKKPLSTRLKELRNNAIKHTQQGLFDQFAPLMELGEREYVLARLTKSADAPLESLLLYGKPYLNSAGAIDVNVEKGGLVAALQQLQGEHDRFFAWIAGNRASKLKAQGRENLFTDSDISALKDLNQGQMENGKGRAMLYEKVRFDLNGYSRAVMDIAEKAGIINGEDRAIWESDFYVPFYRIMEDSGFKGPKNVSGMVNQYAFKKLKGGTDTLNDLMQNTLRNWAHLLSASLKNQAAAAAIATAEKAGIAEAVPVKQKGSVTILEGGKEKHFMIGDPFVMDAITSLEWAGWNNPAMKMMTKAKHYLTLGVTISPTFKIRNLMRDQMAAIGLNPISYNILNNLSDGWKGTSKESEQYAKMLAGGGLMRFGTFLEDDRASHAKRLINSGIKASSILDAKTKVKDAIRSGYDWWQEVGDRSENITRAAIYKQRHEQSIKEGMTADEAHLMASFAARDSMDFSLQGQWASIRFLTQLVPFMNARLQGLYKLGRDGVMPSGRMLAPQIFGDQKVGDKAKAMRFGAVTGTVALASIALMLAYRDDDDWKNREEWDRDTYWWFKVGDNSWTDKKGVQHRGYAYRIPKPFEIGAIGTIAERGLETVLNGFDKESRKLFIDRLGSMITQTFSMNPVPQLLKPAIDLYANTDSFTGRPIETPGMEKLSKSERIGQNTSATAQAIGKATSLVGLSPAQVDFVVDSYFSWLGTHIVMTADFAVHPLMGLPDKPARKWPTDYFVIGDFAKDLPARQSKYISKFYEQSKEVQQAMADIRHYQALGNTVKARELMDENKDKLRLFQMYSHAGKQLSEINNRIKIVQARTMDADAKRDEIDRLTQHKIKLTKLTEERRVSRQTGMQE